MQIYKWRLQADWGHISLATLLVVASIWYFFDAKNVSDSIYNIILIAPCVAAITILYLITLMLEVRVHSVDNNDIQSGKTLRDFLRPETIRNAGMMVLLVVYILVLTPLGFEIASFLFIALSLLLQGEFRFGRILIFSALFSAFATWLIKLLSLAPIPTAFM